MQTTSQHLLRYLAVAVVVNKRRRNVMKDLVKVLQQVSGPCHEAAAHVFVSNDDILRICNIVFAAATGMHGCSTCSAWLQHADSVVASLCLTLWRLTQQEQYEYQDAVTQFLINLYVDFDFEGAQQKLAECETVLENDFFLTALKVPGVSAQHDSS